MQFKEFGKDFTIGLYGLFRKTIPVVECATLNNLPKRQRVLPAELFTGHWASVAKKSAVICRDFQAIPSVLAPIKSPLRAETWGAGEQFARQAAQVTAAQALRWQNRVVNNSGRRAVMCANHGA
jgi:hypothetical protein